MFRLFFFPFRKLLANLFPVLFHSIAFLGDITDKIFIQFRQLPFLKLLHHTFKDHFLARNLFLMVFFRECQIKLHFPANLGPYESFLKTGDKRMGTYGERIIFSLSSLKRSSIHKTFIIYCSNIAFLHRPVSNVHGSGIFSSFPVNLGSHFLLAHFRVHLVHGNSLIFSQGNFRLQSHLRRKDKWLSRFKLNNGNLGRGNDFFRTLLQGCVICIGNQIICGILIKQVLAVHLLQHFSGRFALTETGNADFVLVFLICTFNSLFQLFSRHFDGQLRHIFL